MMPSRDILSKIHRPDPFWPSPLTVERTRFKHKALGAFHANLAMGCFHGCRFCYVPFVSIAKQAPRLRKFGVYQPVIGWGHYLLPRLWDERAFRNSLRKAMATPEHKLQPDGNRAVVYCSTTDPFQNSRQRDGEVRQFHEQQMGLLFRRSLEIIRDESDLRVRILTRSPLAEGHFALMKSLGDRLLFGMSLPSLDDELVKLYETQAPSALERLECLQTAKETGLHVYVVAAPTFPEQSIEDFRKFLMLINSLSPVTVFHEPINVRCGNADFMSFEFHRQGREFPGDTLYNKQGWAVYAARSLTEFEQAAQEVGLEDRLKLWPDPDLLEEAAMDAVVEEGLFPDQHAFAKWIYDHRARPSAWPDSTDSVNPPSGTSFPDS